MHLYITTEDELKANVKEELTSHFSPTRFSHFMTDNFFLLNLPIDWNSHILTIHCFSTL